MTVGRAGLCASTEGCDSTSAGGSLDGRSGAMDALVDPGYPRRVVALAYLEGDGA